MTPFSSAVLCHQTLTLRGNLSAGEQGAQLLPQRLRSFVSAYRAKQDAGNVLNPQTGSLCRTPDDFAFSSGCNIHPSRFLQTHTILALLLGDFQR